MSVFYVLPPRPLLADHLADYLGSWLPGLDWNGDTRTNLTEAVRAAATCQPDVYLVFREELPDGLSTSQALMDGFGAEAGDEVIEVRTGLSPAARRWQIRSRLILSFSPRPIWAGDQGSPLNRNLLLISHRSSLHS